MEKRFPAVFATLFPKKAGAELERAKPFVDEVYKGYYGPDVAVPTGVRAVALGRIGHLTWHSIPEDEWRNFRRACAVALAFIWLFLYPTAMKVRTVVCAALYSFVEFAFTFVERGIPYTSVAQAAANLCYLPVLLDGYGWLFRRWPIAYVLFFPVNIWILEIVEELLVCAVYGQNVAWCYKDYADEHWDGCVRVGHGIFWLALGGFVYFGYPVLCDLTSHL